MVGVHGSKAFWPARSSNHKPSVGALGIGGPGSSPFGSADPIVLLASPGLVPGIFAFSAGAKARLSAPIHRTFVPDDGSMTDSIVLRGSIGLTLLGFEPKIS